MSSLSAVRTARALNIVDIAAGLILQAPFTITPAGQPGWESATMMLDDVHAGESRALADAADFDDIAFTGGMIRRGNDDPDVVLWRTPVYTHESRPAQADLVLVGGFVFTRSLWDLSFACSRPGRTPGCCR